MVLTKTVNIEETRNALKKAFERVQFDERRHLYTVDNVELVSTTTFLKKFSPEFDSKQMSKAVARAQEKKRVKSKKKSDKYYMNRWRDISKAATFTGTRVHNYAEYNYPDFVERPICEQELGVIEFFSDLAPEYEVLFLELRMFNKDLGKAGTADIILLNKLTGNLIIADWKTNTKNIFQYYKMKKTLLDPFSDLTNTDYFKYALQFSDYQNMIELATDLLIEDRWLVHLSTRDPEKIDLGKSEDKYDIHFIEPMFVANYYKIYKTPDLTKRLLECY